MSGIQDMMDRATSRVFPSSVLLKRELLSGLRMRWVFLVLLMYTAILGFIELQMWPNENSYYYYDPAMRTREFTYGLMATLMMCAAVVIPGLAAASITTEKERDTFDLLHMTLMSPINVVVAKTMYAMGFFVIMSLLSLPFFGVVLFMGGVDWTEVVMIYVFMLFMALYCAAWGVLASAFFKSTVRAVVLSYVFVGATSFGVPIFFGILSEISYSRGFRDLIEFTAKLIFPIITYMDDNSFLKAIPGLIYQTGVITIVALVAAAKLRHPPDAAVADPGKPIDDRKALKDRRQSFPYYLLDPRRRKAEIPERSNPMMVKELRYGAWSRATTLVRAFYISFATFLVVGLVHPLPCIIITLIVAPAFVATSVSREYDQGDIDMLRMTLLTPRQIVMGKLWAGAISLVPIAVALMINLVIARLVSGDLVFRQHYLIFSPITLITCLAASVSLGLFASLYARKTTMAVVLSYVLNAALYFALPIAMIIFYEYLYGYNSYNYSAYNKDFYIAITSPIFSYGEILDRNRINNSMLPEYIFSHGFYWILAFIFTGLSVVMFKRTHMSDK